MPLKLGNDAIVLRRENVIGEGGCFVIEIIIVHELLQTNGFLCGCNFFSFCGDDAIQIAHISLIEALISGTNAVPSSPTTIPMLAEELLR